MVPGYAEHCSKFSGTRHASWAGCGSGTVFALQRPQIFGQRPIPAEPNQIGPLDWTRGSALRRSPKTAELALPTKGRGSSLRFHEIDARRAPVNQAAPDITASREKETPPKGGQRGFGRGVCAREIHAQVRTGPQLDFGLLTFGRLAFGP